MPRQPEVPDADVEQVAGRPAPSSRVALGSDLIVTTAIGYVDSAGLAGLSMRRLGELLGVEAMSLYRHVPGKEELLDRMVERLCAGLEDDQDVLEHPVNGWQDYLQRLAHGMRRVALAHPKSFPLVVSRPPEAPWLRPPLRNLQVVEAFLQALLAEGFGEQQAVAAYRAFTSFLLGHLLLEVSAHGADVGPLDVLEDDEDADDSSFPAVRALRASLSEDGAAQEFDAALENLLERLALLRSAPGEGAD